MVTVGFFSTEIWKELQKTEDEELKRLATALSVTVMQSRANSTTTKYLDAYKRWKLWASLHAIPAFPVWDVHLVLYMQYLAEQKSSKSAAEEIVNSLAWLHQVAGKPSPSHSQIVKSTLGGLQRMLVKPVKKKKLMSKEILAEMVDDVHKNSSLSYLRLMAACLVSFAGFLRAEELSQLRVCDISIGEKWMVINIAKSKTD